ncbi:MAG: hypothetical protein M5U28_49445 [Sandaracinaceae bacterium]|nr:hypothetical protein [Sandaracinaceae bacterium]
MPPIRRWVSARGLVTTASMYSSLTLRATRSRSSPLTWRSQVSPPPILAMRAESSTSTTHMCAPVTFTS